MSLDEKLSNFFSSRFSLKKPSEPTHLLHIYADYVELIVLLNNNDYVTLADIVDRFNDEGINIIEHFKKEDETDKYYFKQRYDAEIGSEYSIRQDLCENYIIQLFEILKDRSFLYKERYPFEVAERKINLKENSNSSQKLYIALLMSSSLNSFKIFNHELTSEFEEVSAKALQQYLGENAIVKETGKNSSYTGNAKEKIKSLAYDVFVEVNNEALNKIPDTNQQERGLDIIAWFPFKDLYANMLVLLFQCACGKNWIEKQDEVKRYEKYLIFKHIKPIVGMFIPYAIITDYLDLHQSDDVLMSGLLFDRNRISGYNLNLEYFETLNSFKIVNQLIDYSEDIV